MSLSVARTKIMKSFRELNLRMEQVRHAWDDSTARKFDKEFIAPLEGQARTAVAAIEQMTKITANAQRDCS